jgi:hypothetical protein
MGAQISTVAGLCAHLSGPRAKAIHDHFMEAGVRVEAGDRALYSVIEQNCERVDRAAADGDVLAVALQGTRHAEHEEVGGLPWAQVCQLFSTFLNFFQLLISINSIQEWNGARAIQMVSNRRVIDSCKEQHVNAPNIHNMLNQAPLGFKCSTKRFKQDNGIPQTTAVPEYMTSSQLSLRKMAQHALMSEIQRDDMSSKQAERRMLAIRDDFTKFAERYGQSGLRVMPGVGSFGSAAVAIEAKHHKMTRRQLKIERKEIASQQIDREDGATALENIGTGTIGL